VGGEASHQVAVASGRHIVRLQKWWMEDKQFTYLRDV